MDVNARKQYLETLLGRYLRDRKRQKGVLLDEIGRTTGQNRKYAIRKLRVLASGTTRMPRKRPAVYGREVRQALEKVWTIYDFPCGQRLSPILRTDLQRLREWGELPISNRTAGMLIKISPATIDRLLMPVKETQKVGRRYRPKSSGLLAKRIPLRLGEWQNARVGEIDMDLVLHCGATVAGDYGHSLSTLDVFTG